MANINLKEKTESGYRNLYPLTLAKNVITATGNIQSDISKLIDEINKLKGDDFLDWVIDCEELTAEELNTKFMEAVKSKKKVKIHNFIFPTTPNIDLGNGFLKFEYFDDELQTVKVKYTRDEFSPGIITEGVYYLTLLGWDEDTEEYYETPTEDIDIFDQSLWKFTGGHLKLGEVDVAEVVTGVGANKYLKISDFNSDINPAIFKEVILNVAIKTSDGVSGATETINRQFVIRRPETYDTYDYINYLKNGRITILFSGYFNQYNFILYRVTNTSTTSTATSVTLKIQAVGNFY